MEPTVLPEQHVQKQFYKELDGKMNIQTEPVEHNKDCEWSKKVKEKLRDTQKQEDVIVTAKDLKRAIARMNRKAAGLDHVQGFWFKKPTSLHPKTQTTSTGV